MARRISSAGSLRERRITEKSILSGTSEVRTFSASEGARVVIPELLGPLPPGPQTIHLMDRREQCRFLGPFGLLPEAIERLRQLGVRSRQQPVRRLLQARDLEVAHGHVVHSVGTIAARRQVVLLEQPIRLEPSQVDEPWVPRQGRVARVGGVSRAGRHQGQKLPQGDPAVSEPVHEAVGPLPQVADTGGPGQGGGVEQNPRGAGQAIRHSQ